MKFWTPFYNQHVCPRKLANKAKRSTIRERTKFMLSNHLFSDVTFVVRKSDCKSESKQVIPAHKFVLSIGSPVFEAMFYGELAETRDSIEMPDCEYESLLELFRYMYSDEVNLSGSNVMRVLYLAKKYIVPSLAEKCSEYLENYLDPSNVFNILPTAEKYEEKELVDRCWKVVDKETKVAVKSDGFAIIERSLLEAVVSRDTLTIEEIDLFKAVDQWATKRCQKQGLSASGGWKRKILGERIIKSIRFPVMKQQEFAAVIIDAKILTPDEISTFFKFFSSTLTSPVGFPETRRSGTKAKTTVLYRCGRFESMSVDGCWDYGGGCKDILAFTVDKDMTLHGLCLCGSKNDSYTISLEIKDASNNSRLVSKSGTFSSNPLQYKLANYYGFEVLFDRPVNLKKNTKYQIEALISGPSSGRGTGGLSTVLCTGVTFTFSTSDSSPVSNGTSCARGQFPEFLFSL